MGYGEEWEGRRIGMLSYSSVCFAATSPSLGEELERQTF